MLTAVLTAQEFFKETGGKLHNFLNSELLVLPKDLMLKLLCNSLCTQTADLGLDIGAQGEPLGYRPDGMCLLFPLTKLLIG